MKPLLLVLLLVAAVVEVALALVGGPATAVAGAGLLTAVGLITARYVTGFASQDSGLRLAVRTLDSRRPGLGDWQRVVEDSLTARGEQGPLLIPRLQRLYAARLAERHAVSLYEQPERAAALVPPEVWALIAPGTTPPLPIPPVTLRAAVAGLHAL
ncbi:hypothetical protein CFP65_7497 [Kitasatospora sp. MMS16-BH015]|uniref:hypothetical protein n=1 Tax=Kitasatospora sp. MMS16-BH015 TaxID=2018025 RepID=UPI000CA3157C|nr:hypothetical protein [Kitasatospora sp. MMS16-BH015]AUG82075.1 hypothetical protein CFP65_7497 [Kitasatospora sp. MMS16-BH015]